MPGTSPGPGGPEPAAAAAAAKAAAAEKSRPPGRGGRAGGTMPGTGGKRHLGDGNSGPSLSEGGRISRPQPGKPKRGPFSVGFGKTYGVGNAPFPGEPRGDWPGPTPEPWGGVFPPGGILVPGENDLRPASSGPRPRGTKPGRKSRAGPNVIFCC
ncbi:hypothetical protein TGRUB_362930 [Toxoplasma gondii RUB]|nr:hypothetical protein TGDOM2_362930 [Toxoplasma gondii GAB2-2007-GAL-DOM2]KFG63055.1 hypothetical protein TGRUB_362930 [Toxoplasma gondii RUB]